MQPYDQVSIVGVGLLGGSVALALRERGLAGQIVGIGRNAAKLETLVSQGIIDRATTNLAAGVAAASLVVICTPVEKVAETAAQVLVAAPADCVVTDVGSTKCIIIAQLAQAGSKGSGRFVGSHPLAGDHRTGAEFARTDLFTGRTVVVTPDTNTDSAACKSVIDLWTSLGALVVTLSPDQHDAAVASTSHLPHAVASALALATPESMLDLAATGWSDTTRVAAADPALWRQIFLTNGPQVLAALDLFDQHLSTLREAIEAGDAAKLEQLLAEGKRIRDAVGN